ncbi:MAG: DUF3662 domain-containing protein [Clostridia bacterium]|nr:DUF3662 domain-containing protein [Clostridia bacterium]
MDWLEKKERFLQRFFEGLFHRGKAVPLQPVEIAKKLAQKMLAQRTISVNNVYVPNVYLVNINPKDFQRLSAFEKSLATELADYLRKKAEEQNFTMVGEPRVELELDEELEPGEIWIHARMEEARLEENETSSPEEGNTLVFPAVDADLKAPPQTVYKLTVIAGFDKGRSFLVRPGKHTLGRQPACDFVLTDKKVSRRHCLLEQSHDRILVTDLGSRNGVLVNGEKVERAFLNPGDSFQVGSTVLKLETG